MEYAIVVDGVYKQFGKPLEPFWKRFPRSEKNVDKPSSPERALDRQVVDAKAETNAKKNGPSVVMAVDHVSFNVKEGKSFGVLEFDVVRQPMKVQQLIRRETPCQ